MAILKDQVVLVTGSSEGIGREMVRLFSREGARVVAVARRQDKLNELATEVGEAAVLPVAADVTRLEDMQRAAAAAMDRWGRIDALVNNAGVAKYVPLADMQPEDFQWQLDVNLMGPYNACKAVLPSMLKQKGGQILNIGSMLGTRGIPGGTAYCATKFGLMGFTEALRMEVHKEGIRVMVLCPGLVQTDFSGRPAASKATGLKPETVALQALNMLAAPPDAMPVTLLLPPFGLA